MLQRGFFFVASMLNQTMLTLVQSQPQQPAWDEATLKLFQDATKATAKCFSKADRKASQHNSSGVVVKAIRLNGHLDSFLAAWASRVESSQLRGGGGQNKETNGTQLRVAMLIRDPRGLINSRLHLGWYASNEICHLNVPSIISFFSAIPTTGGIRSS
jgi:hypothetical protein